jgi:hypothetical protein
MGHPVSEPQRALRKNCQLNGIESNCYWSPRFVLMSRDVAKAEARLTCLHGLHRLYGRPFVRFVDLDDLRKSHLSNSRVLVDNGVLGARQRSATSRLNLASNRQALFKLVLGSC